MIAIAIASPFRSLFVFVHTSQLAEHVLERRDVTNSEQLQSQRSTEAALRVTADRSERGK